MGKITVKHYLNKSLSKKSGDNNTRHQVYVQVTVKRQVNRMRSQLDQFLSWEFNEKNIKPSDIGLTQAELESALKNEQSEWGRALLLQRRIIEDIITFVDPFERSDFSIRNFTQIYLLATQHINIGVKYRAIEYLVNSMNKKWNKLLDIMNIGYSFEYIMLALEQIGTDNEDFRNTVLVNTEVNAARIVSNNIDDFIEIYSKSINKQYPELVPFNFYWFRDNTTEKFIDYLLSKEKITEDLIPTVKSLFDVIYQNNIPWIKSLTSIPKIIQK